jgi:transcriptional regulator with XRE-family HTH domain
MDDEGLQTEGRRLLLSYLQQPGRSQSALARALKIAQASVSLWTRGRSRPEPHHRESLELLANIPAESWQTAEERESVDRVRESVALVAGAGG